MSQPNVLVLVVDALQHRRLGIAGHVPSPTPNLDALAARGHVFTRHFAAGCPTHFALPSIFASTWPLDEGGYEFGVADRQFNIAEAFQRGGYQTSSFTVAFMAHDMWGYTRGFDEVYPLHAVFVPSRGARRWYRDHARRRLDAGHPISEIAAFMTPSLERLLESVARSAQKVDAALAEGRLEFSPLLHPWPYDRLVALYEEEIERLRADPAAYIVAFAENDRDEFIDRVSALRLEPVKRDPVDDLAIRRGLPYTGRDQVGSAAYALRQFWRWAERRDRSKPYFAYVHLLDVHDRTPVSSDLGGPDLVKEEVDRALVRVTYVEGQAAGVRAGDLAYDLAVHQSDHWIGDLLRRMQAAGELENTIVVVTADHGHDAGFPPRPGVNIMDHVDEMYHIPLIAVGPGIRPGFDDRLCSAVDLAPTVMAWAGLPAPTGVRGRSFADRSAAPRDWVLFEHLGSGPCDFSALPIRLSIRSATTKVTCLVPPITSSRDGSLVGLYDLEKDPYEYANLIYDSPKPPDTEALLTAAEERVGEIVRQLMELVRQAQEGE